MTPFQKHKLKWINCDRCDLCKTRDKVCLVRGKLPCSVLFVGEAPGPSEDVVGQPFVGPAGHLLDEIIEVSLERCDSIKTSLLRIAFTNLVGCLPKSEETGAKFIEPPEYAIDACAPRLVEIVRIAKPRLIVCVGKLAKRHISGQAQFATEEEEDFPHWLNGGFMNFVEITHPAAILRSDDTARASKSLMIKRCVVTLSDAFSELVK